MATPNDRGIAGDTRCQQQTIGHTSTVYHFLVVVRVEKVASDAHCERMRPLIVLSYVVLLLFWTSPAYPALVNVVDKEKATTCLTGRAENVKGKILFAPAPWDYREKEYGSEHDNRITAGHRNRQRPRGPDAARRPMAKTCADLFAAWCTLGRSFSTSANNNPGCCGEGNAAGR